MGHPNTPNRRRRTNPRRDDRKLMQLCAQVQRAIDHILAADCDDPLLDDLLVEAVEPLHGSGHLLVVLGCPFAPQDLDLDEVRDRLDRTKGLIRSEVAAWINRKRTPELTFRVLEPGEVRL